MPQSFSSSSGSGGAGEKCFMLKVGAPRKEAGETSGKEGYFEEAKRKGNRYSAMGRI